MSEEDFNEFPDVDETELMKVFETIASLIRNSIKQSPDIGGKSLASIHYKLFSDYEDNKNHKARLALLYLQAQLGKLISDAGKSQEIGMLIYAYTRHWLRFVLILESQMASLLTWYTSKEVLPINIVPLISSIEELLPVALNPTSPLPDSTIKEFKEFTTDAYNDEAGLELKKYLDYLMRQALYHKDEASLETLSQFQKSFPDLMNVDPTNFEFNTLFHQFAEAWFEDFGVRKKWITTLIEKLDLLSDKGLLRMARGFYSIKLSGKPFREVVAEIQNN